jgi:hypothetical protein
MSFAALRWAMGISIPCQQKMTLLALADFSNDDGAAFPSMAKLSEKAGLCVRATRESVRKLERLNLISTHAQIRSYGQTSNYFILAVESAAKDKKVVRFRPSAAPSLAPPAYYAAPPAYPADITSNNNLTLDILEPFQEKDYLVLGYPSAGLPKKHGTAQGN